MFISIQGSKRLAAPLLPGKALGFMKDSGLWENAAFASLAVMKLTVCLFFAVSFFTFPVIAADENAANKAGVADKSKVEKKAPERKVFTEEERRKQRELLNRYRECAKNYRAKNFKLALQ